MYIKKVERCENCGKHKIDTKDYREIDGMIGKIFVCRYCANLNGEWFYRVRVDGHDPKKVLEE